MRRNSLLYDENIGSGEEEEDEKKKPQVEEEISLLNIVLNVC